MNLDIPSSINSSFNSSTVPIKRLAWTKTIFRIEERALIH
jgi:hypothetical protein